MQCQLVVMPKIDNAWILTTVIFKEFIVGILIGYSGFIVFTAIYLAGQFIDMQMGFGIVSVIDPTSNIQVPITANFYYTITMINFYYSKWTSHANSSISTKL